MLLIIVSKVFSIITKPFIVFWILLTLCVSYSFSSSLFVARFTRNSSFTDDTFASTIYCMA